jgi:hypothetical protein
MCMFTMYRNAKDLPFSQEELRSREKDLYQKQNPNHQYMSFVREYVR